ncbi:MAG: hypothetical protein KZQ66_08275, partial [Candidatus Thiodiazotropha sp. (ex Lucinoma aequizonata)]|nr:hypothetical protein [Candidatus Thiodiazotropha sp. (ex Lucinoma aequizonata)]MCU7888240.1 hypothetical protein [Candidatus Thiodiazotropha sp. (ex Lucinoma aequizonata)]MCU7895807.1 hypothetical protein [Candidatus Thiodiazotropha sp. (ex Lucinoma aequizonata)]MCU7900436.1 hypothetical protein [Candidatus Thiodiazotropha sp. (ex Lucinoma aequizonata)]MCU7901990.1 hypothetical protein [Candidatus Thiodiazotropha sp. (ex Lucinoma aequizonata)]
APGTYAKAKDGFFEKIGLKGGADKNEDTPGTSGEGKKGSFDKEENDVAWPKGKVFKRPESTDPETVNTTRIDTADKLIQRLKAIEQLRQTEIRGGDSDALELYGRVKTQLHENTRIPDKGDVAVNFEYRAYHDKSLKYEQNIKLEATISKKNKSITISNRRNSGMPFHIADIVRNVFLSLDETKAFIPEQLVNEDVVNQGAMACINDYRKTKILDRKSFLYNYNYETQNGRSNVRIANQLGQEIYEFKITGNGVPGDEYNTYFYLRPKSQPGPLLNELPLRTNNHPYGPRIYVK